MGLRGEHVSIKSSFSIPFISNLWEEPVIRLYFRFAIAVLLATSYGTRLAPPP